MHPVKPTAHEAGKSADARFPTCERAPDVLVQDFGSVTILWPRTADAKAWFAAHVDTRQTWGVGTVCEPRHVAPIVAGLVDAGFDVVRSA